MLSVLAYARQDPTLGVGDGVYGPMALDGVT